MQGAPKRQVNAEEMLAELKRALESSTPAPLPPPAASTPSRPSSAGRDSWRLQIDRGSDGPIGRPTNLRKPTRRSSRRWKLTAAGLALAGAAAVASLALMDRAPDLPTQELSAAPTAGLARPQNDQAPKPSSDSRSLTGDSRQGAPLQPGALETRPAPADSGPVPAGPKAEVGAPEPVASSVEPAPASPGLAAIPVPSQPIGPDGAPIATTPPTPASTDSAPPLAEAPKTAAPLAATPTVRPDEAPVATTPATPASTDSAPLADAPKPNATPAAPVSNEPARPVTPKIASTKRPHGKATLKKPARSANGSAKPVARIERQSAEPAAPKEAESAPQPAPAAGDPATAAPVTPAAIGQRFADGVTHALGYMIRLPGALVPHPTDPNAGAH